MELLKGRHCQYSVRESSQKAPRSQQRPGDPAPPHCSKTFAHVFDPLSSAELLFGVVLSELLLLVVFEIMSVVLVEVPIGLVGLVGLPVVLVGMLSVELMGGSVVGTVLLVVVVGGVMLLLHWALRMAPSPSVQVPSGHAVQEV